MRYDLVILADNTIVSMVPGPTNANFRKCLPLVGANVNNGGTAPVSVRMVEGIGRVMTYVHSTISSSLAALDTSTDGWSPTILSIGLFAWFIPIPRRRS